MLLKKFAIFTGKHLCWSLFSVKLQASDLQPCRKETRTQVLSCEICEFFKNTYFEEHRRTFASDLRISTHLRSFLWYCHVAWLNPFKVKTPMWCTCSTIKTPERLHDTQGKTILLNSVLNLILGVTEDSTSLCGA